MPTPVFPDNLEAEAAVLGPTSISWRYGSDPRIYLAAGGALLLQVAHPTVGAGVKQHSQFMNEPWDRLLRTIDYLNLITYSGDDAIAVGRHVRELHKQIKGTKDDGSRYHALEPDAYAWVQATLIHAIISANQHFARRMSAEHTERFYREYRGISRLLGVRGGDLPDDYAGFRSYFDEMAHTRLQRTPAVDDVLHTINAFPRPDRIPAAAGPAWSVVRPFGAQALRLGIGAVIDADLRRKLGVPWSAIDEAQYQTLGAALRPVTPLLPQAVRITGPHYLRWRRDAIRRGPLAAQASNLDLRAAA